jgi:hypothetical protein
MRDMKTTTNLDATIATIRAAGASAGRGGNGPERTNVDLAIWGEVGQVLRACAAIGLSRTVRSVAQRGPDGAIQTVKIWDLSDLDGEVRGSVTFVSGHDTEGLASANVGHAYTRPLACFAA